MVLSYLPKVNNKFLYMMWAKALYEFSFYLLSQFYLYQFLSCGGPWMQRIIIILHILNHLLTAQTFPLQGPIHHSTLINKTWNQSANGFNPRGDCVIIYLVMGKENDFQYNIYGSLAWGPWNGATGVPEKLWFFSGMGNERHSLLQQQIIRNRNRTIKC